MDPNISSLTDSIHIDQLLVGFILALNQGFEASVFGVIHRRTLAIIASATVIEVRRLIYEDLAEFINK